MPPATVLISGVPLHLYPEERYRARCDVQGSQPSAKVVWYISREGEKEEIFLKNEVNLFFSFIIFFLSYHYQVFARTFTFSNLSPEVI